VLGIRRTIFFRILGWWTISLSVACSWVESAAQMMVRAFEFPGEYFLHILSIWCLPKSSGAV